MKHFNSNTDDDNTNDDDDDKIRCKMSDINMILSRLGNIVTKNDRKKRELYEIEKKKNHSDKNKEEIYDNLVKIVKTLDKKEEYQYRDRDDLDYYRINDTQNLFDNVNHDDYYKSILVKTLSKARLCHNLYKIMPCLRDIINDHKSINES